MIYTYESPHKLSPASALKQTMGIATSKMKHWQNVTE